MTYCFSAFTEIFPLMVLRVTLFTSFLVLNISLLSFLLCLPLSLWFSHFSTIHFLLLSSRHFFKVVLHTLFTSSKMSHFFSTYFLIFWSLICANMYYLLKKSLSKCLITLPPLNLLETEFFRTCYKINWKCIQSIQQLFFLEDCSAGLFSNTVKWLPIPSVMSLPARAFPSKYVDSIK